MGCKAPRPPPGAITAESLAIHPEVQELIHHYQINEDLGRQLSHMIYKRPDTVEDDIRRLWNDLEKHQNPSACLCIKLKDMRQGIFVGMKAPQQDLKKLEKKFKLDYEAVSKLEDNLREVETLRPELIKQLDKHLELSNKPSKYVMMLLKKIRSGEPLEDPTCDPAP